MGRVSQSIPNLFNGVSQQSPNIRLSSQGAEQINGYSSIVDGLRKRPPTNHLDQLQALPASDNVFIHYINRDADERYTVMIVDGVLKVWDLEGNAKTVNDIATASAYLSGSTNHRNDFAMVTVADTTFIINKTKTVTSTGTGSAAAEECWVWIKRPQPLTKYEITLAGTAYSHTTAGTGNNIGTDTIAAALKVAIDGGSGGFTTTQYGSCLHITRASAFTTSFKDGYGDQGMIAFEHEISVPGDLPPQCLHDYKVRVTGDDDADDDYYLKFVQEDGSGFGTGHWEEIRYWAEDNFSLNNTTMPIKLVRQANGEFNLEKCTWDDREAGDATTAELPSFVGQKIKDVFFFRNRLGFLSNENIILSRAGDYFNFFRETALKLLDSDPIDIAVAHTKVSDLRHAMPWNEALILFSDQTQFTMDTGDELLTPENAKVDVISEFAYDADVRPTGAGAYLYFASPRGGYTAIREYFVDKQNLTKDSADVTAHCPKYIPDNAFRITASTSEDALFVLSKDEPTVIYVYKWYWSGDEKLQSSWSKWTFGTDAKILGVDIIESTLYLVVKRQDGLYLESIMLQSGVMDGNLSFEICLDRKCELTGSYDSDDDETTWTFPFADESTSFIIVMGPDFTDEGNVIQNVTHPTNDTLVAPGDHTDGECFVGRDYIHEYTFSPQFVRKDDGETITEGRLQLQRMTVNFNNSGKFKARVTPGAQNSFEYAYTHNLKLGTPEATIGDVYIATGKFTFPIMAKADNVEIKIINDSYFPSAIQNAEWEGLFVTHSKRLT